MEVRLFDSDSKLLDVDDSRRVGVDLDELGTDVIVGLGVLGLNKNVESGLTKLRLSVEAL